MSTQGLLHVNGQALQVDIENRTAGLSWSPGVAGMIFIHALWCGHCKAMMPAAIEAATQVHEQQAAQFIALDEALLDPGDRAALQIAGFPTIMRFDPDGNFTGIYNGGRTTAALLEGLTGP